jgi:pyroglutamyl-peptidase
LSSATRTILVTGFEPFGGETVNASWEAARKLEGWRRGELAAVARLLPCAYDASVKELVRAIEAVQPEAVLMTGQAARRAMVCVERFARNLDDAAAPDNLGVLRKAVRISEAAPERLEAAAPVRAIADAIRAAGIPARVSRNAGGFVCNHLYFGALRYLGALGGPTRAVFLHLPATPEQTAPAARTRRLTAADAAKALRAAATAMVDVQANGA